jgi:hypothetical protein
MRLDLLSAIVTKPNLRYLQAGMVIVLGFFAISTFYDGMTSVVSFLKTDVWPTYQSLMKP